MLAGIVLLLCRLVPSARPLVFGEDWSLDHEQSCGMLGWNLRPRTVIVEGSTDVTLFQLAARLERDATGADLFADGD